MADYIKQTWTDQEDTNPDRYLVDGIQTEIEKDTSGVTVVGSPVNAQRMNYIENGIFNSQETANTNQDKQNGRFEIPTASTSVETVTVQVNRDEVYVDDEEIRFFLSADFSPGVDILLQINNSGGTGLLGPFNIKDIDDINIQSLDKGYVTVRYVDDVIDYFSYDSNLQKNSDDIAILRTGATVGGTSNAITLTTPTDTDFDLTVELNPITFIPASDNTSGVTINIDGQGALSLLKPDGSGGTTALEAGDLINGVPVTIYRRVSGNFFLLAPKDGSNIKNIQRGSTSLPGGTSSINVSISSVDTNSAIVMISSSTDAINNDDAQVRVELVNSTTIRLQRVGTDQTCVVDWVVVEYNNVKSVQRGIGQYISATTHTVTHSAVDRDKSILFCSFRQAFTGANLAVLLQRYRFISDTSFNINQGDSSGAYTYYAWQIIEFN